MRPVLSPKFDFLHFIPRGAFGHIFWPIGPAVNIVQSEAHGVHAHLYDRCYNMVSTEKLYCVVDIRLKRELTSVQKKLC